MDEGLIVVVCCFWVFDLLIIICIWFYYLLVLCFFDFENKVFEFIKKNFLKYVLKKSGKCKKKNWLINFKYGFFFW